MHEWFKSYNGFTTIKKKVKTSNTGIWGAYPEAIDLNIELHTQILIWASISEVGSQLTISEMGPSL